MTNSNPCDLVRLMLGPIDIPKESSRAMLKLLNDTG